MSTKRELLEEKTVRELKQMAKDKGLSGYSNMRKSELIDLITDNYTKAEIKSWSERRMGVREPSERRAGGTCPECGAELRTGAKFCTKCGARVVEKSKTGKQEKKEGRKNTVKVECRKVDNWSDEMDDLVIARMSTDQPIFEIGFLPLWRCIELGEYWMDNINESDPKALGKYLTRKAGFNGQGVLYGHIGDGDVPKTIREAVQDGRQECIESAEKTLSQCTKTGDELFALCIMSLLRFGVLPYQDREIEYSVSGVKKILESKVPDKTETVAEKLARVYGTKDFRIAIYSHIYSMLIEPSKPETEVEVELMERLPEGLEKLKDLREGPELDRARELSEKTIEEVKKAVEEKTVEPEFMMKAESENKSRKTLVRYLEEKIMERGVEFIEELRDRE